MSCAASSRRSPTRWNRSKATCGALHRRRTPAARRGVVARRRRSSSSSPCRRSSSRATGDTGKIHVAGCRVKEVPPAADHSRRRRSSSPRLPPCRPCSTRRPLVAPLRARAAPRDRSTSRRPLVVHPRSRCCALETQRRFRGRGDDPGSDIRASPGPGARRPRRRCTTFRTLSDTTCELFLKVGASRAQVERGARRARVRSATCSSFRFVSQADAYEDLQEGLRRPAGARARHEAVRSSGVVPIDRQARRVRHRRRSSDTSTSTGRRHPSSRPAVRLACSIAHVSRIVADRAERSPRACTQAVATWSRASAGAEGARADVAGAEAERDRDHGEGVVHDLEADRVVLAADDHDERDPDVERPRAQRDQEPGDAAGHARRGYGCDASRDRIEAPPDRLGRAVREREAHVGGRDAALGVQHALEDRRVRVDVRGPDHGQQRLGVGAAVFDLAREPALDHRDEPVGAQVRGRRDRADRAHAHEREQQRVLAAEHAEAVRARRRAPRACRRRAWRRPASRRRCSAPRELEQTRRAEVATGAGRDVVRRSREPGSRPRPRGSARRCPRPTGARSTARRRARRRRRACRRAPPWRGSSRRCCSSRCRRSRGCPRRVARAYDRVDDGLLLVGVERARLARRAEGDDAAHPGGRVLVTEPLDRARRRPRPARRTA